MTTRIHTADLEELIAEANHASWFSAQDAGITERTYSNVTLLGEGSYTELFFEGIHIGYGDLALRQPTKLYIESEIETVEMHFLLDGETVTKSQETGEVVQFGANQHNIYHIRGFKGNSDWSNKSRLRVFEVNLFPSIFDKYLPQRGAIFENLRKRLYKEEPSQLLDHNLPITPPMRQIIWEILNCRRQGVFKKMFIEAKVIELLMLQFEQISARESDSFRHLEKSDVEKMYAVKEIILKNVSNPISLIDLARQVGTNEFTLKKGFKALFGTTVFGYWQEVKMQEAKKLLLEEPYSVSAVSERIGYKNPQHFSTAFKKFYGFSPSKLKD
jgi:AraC-like DNA-binding protein